MGRGDLLDKQPMMNPQVYKDEFPIMDPYNIPKPNMDRLFQKNILDQIE